MRLNYSQRGLAYKDKNSTHYVRQLRTNYKALAMFRYSMLSNKEVI